jgi:glycosyltransferase involved in cell wall biosynthesis
MSILVSAVIITKNAGSLFRSCLQSLTWCDEIVVVDSGSTDETLSICEEFNCRIIHRDFQGFGAQKHYAVLQAKNDWILNIDADEIITNELKEDILKMLPLHAASLPVFQIPRTLIFLKQKFDHGRESKQLINRLFNKKECNFDFAAVHETLVKKGPLIKLSGELLHYSYRDLHEYFEKFNQYTSKAVIELNRKNKSRSRLAIVVLSPLYFLKFYFLERNFLNGYAGLVWSVICSFYVFVKYNKLYEYNLSTQKSVSEFSIVKMEYLQTALLKK